MHIAHRISEDLDFITHSSVLPTGALKGLVTLMQDAGFAVERDDDTTAYEEFLIIGRSLHDYQQNFIVGGVKLNIFTPQPDLASVVKWSVSEVPVVATLQELFKTKALAASNRCTSRDWIDLYMLFQSHGFTLQDLVDSFKTDAIPNPRQRISQAFQNLCRGVASAADPGYESLLENPPSLSKIAAFFSTVRDEYESTESFQAFRTPG